MTKGRFRKMCNIYEKERKRQIVRINEVFKVAPCSFSIALRTKVQVICALSNEDISVFQYFMTSTWAQKAKLTVIFSRFLRLNFVKFDRLVKIFYFSRSTFQFSGKFI